MLPPSLPQPLRLLQLTDTHLFADAAERLRGCATATTLGTVLKQVQQAPALPDAILMTGDLSQDETLESYRRLQAMVAPLAVPTYWIPGNHDCPESMASVLSEQPLRSQKSFSTDHWHIILLNSQQPGQTAGHLSVDTLDWLQQQLQLKPHHHTLVALHHPPCPVGSDWMDQLGLANPEAFWAVLDNHPQVRLIIFGHIHQEFEGFRQGVAQFGCPSTCIQFRPRESKIAIDSQGPGYRWLELYPDGQFITRVERTSPSPVPLP